VSGISFRQGHGIFDEAFQAEFAQIVAPIPVPRPAIRSARIALKLPLTYDPTIGSMARDLLRDRSRV
jgi:hypothetical protein